MTQNSPENPSNPNPDSPTAPWYVRGTASARGYIGFESSSFGAVLALPVSFLNSITTIQGAGIILPSSIGYPVGILLSLIYFFVLISDKAKRIHPLRRLLLITIFSSASTYCSLFSIYGAMSGENLENRAKEPAKKEHSKFAVSATQTIESLKSEFHKNLPSVYKQKITLEQDIEANRIKRQNALKNNKKEEAEEINTSLQRN